MRSFLHESAFRAGTAIPALGALSRDWIAWYDRLPDSEDSFHVVGDVLLPHAGLDAVLSPRNVDPLSSTLRLEMVLIQRPGDWPRFLTWASIHYACGCGDRRFGRVRIVHEDEELATVLVEHLE